GGGVVARAVPAPTLHRRVVALGVNAPAAAVVVLARPGDDEVPVRVDRDRGELLVVGGGGVDAELAAERVARGVVALGVDPPGLAAILALARPSDDEVAVGVHRHRGVPLVAG